MKKVIKRLTGIGLMIALVMAVIFPVLADNGTVNLKDASCTEGDNVTVTMQIRPAVSGAEVYLSYDASYLEYTGASGGADFFNQNGGGGSISILTYFNNGVGEIDVSLNFKSLKAGTTYVSVSSQVITDAGGDPITMSVAPAEVIIQAKATQPPETNPPETNPPETDPPAPPETDPPQTDPPHEHVYDVMVVVQENYRTSISSDGKYTIYWDQVRFDCACGEAHGDDLLDKENHREERETEPETTHAPSSEARLSALNFSGVGELSPAFNPDTYSYRLTVGGDVTGLNVRYSTKDENATAYFWPWIDGQMHDGEQKTIPYGEMVFTIRVTAEDETTTRDYKVTIVRPEPETQPPETKKPEETTPEATTPEETTPEETTPEETTPEETTPEETTPEETTEPPTEPAPIVLGGSAVMLKILEIPEDLEIPDGYAVVQIVGQGGVTYHGLAPEGNMDPDHLILYGVPVKQLPADPEDPETRYEEAGEAGLYVYDRAQATIQRFGMIVQPTVPETEPTTAEPETTAPEPATTVAPETAAPTTQAPTTTVAPSSEEKQTPIGQGGGVPWWVWLGLLILFGICLTAIIGLMISKDKLEKRLTQAERLSPEEEEAFLAMNTDALYDAAKSANPPKRYSMEDIENLDDVLDQADGDDR